MADDAHPDESADFSQLVRAVRDLTLRVQRLEQRFDEVAAISDKKHSRHASRRTVVPLESRIGSHWLSRIGVVAVLFGVAYLLRYVFVSGWVSVTAWVGVGVCAGLVIIVCSEWFRGHGYRVLSLSLKATGIGVSYLSLWAGMELYKVLSGPPTFSGLVILTALNGVLAFRESAEVLAALALIGGFLTPLLISIPSSGAPLFSYIALLDCATAVIALKRDWWKLLPVSFLGTTLLYIVWYFEHYSRAELPLAIAAATLYFVIFCATMIWVQRGLSATRSPRLLTSLTVANTAMYLAALYLLLRHLHPNVTSIPALSLSAVYFALTWETERSRRFGANILAALYSGLGIASAAVALAIRLPSDWLSMGWLVEAALIIAVGFWRDLAWLRWGALLLLCAAVVKAFAYDVWRLGLEYRTLSFIGLGILLLLISFAYQRYGGFSKILKTGKDSTGRLP